MSGGILSGIWTLTARRKGEAFALRRKPNGLGEILREGAADDFDFPLGIRERFPQKMAFPAIFGEPSPADLQGGLI